MEIKSIVIHGEGIDSVTVDYYPETDSVRVFIHTKPGILKKVSDKIGKKTSILESKEKPEKVEVMSFRRAEGTSIF